MGEDEFSEWAMNDGEHAKREWLSLAFERYEAPLVRYALWMTGDLECARDVVQDTFLRLCEREPSEVQERLAQWLFTVCRNRAVDVCRKDCRMASLSDAHLETWMSGEPSPADIAERDDEAGHALRLLSALPSNQQEVVRLKFQFGLSYKEISHVTNLTVTHVGFLLHTALKTLRRQFRTETGAHENHLNFYENQP